jgi:HAD superfamily hydrolase (TIGR01509 family)
MQAMIFDLDSTLIDTVYAHVFAWQRALAESGLPIEGWRIHRRIGMSGGLFTRAVARELGRELAGAEVEVLRERHGELFGQMLPDPRPLPGALDLLQALQNEGIPFGIATSGQRPDINRSLEILGIGPEVVVECPQVPQPKPAAELLLSCQQRMRVRREDCCVVGDAVWDLLGARRAGIASVGLLSGGYGAEELSRAGAFRVYRDPLELLESLDEVGVGEAAPV